MDSEETKMICRLHGSGCRIPWGWDPEHSDVTHPWTLADADDLCHRPYRYAYLTVEAYVEAFHLHRAVQRDNAPTTAENKAAYRVWLQTYGDPQRLLWWEMAQAGDYEGLVENYLDTRLAECQVADSPQS